MKNELNDYFFRMVQVDSESGEERDFLQLIDRLFSEELGAQTRYDSYGNLIIRVKEKNCRKKEPLLFCCHGDTVKPGKGIEPILKNGVIYSKGDTILGADDKAGIAEILVALKRASQMPPVEVFITRQEEVGLSGSSHLDQDCFKSRKGYVLDSEALDEIIVGGPSRIEMKITMIGKAAHAVEPEKGISAIEMAAQGISLLQTGWVDPLTVVNIGLIEGGQVINAVPEKTVIQIDCRSQQHQRCLAQSRKIRKVFQTVARARGGRVEIETKLGLKASRIPEDSPVVKLAKKAIQSVGLKPQCKVICGGTDASNLNQKGIQAAVLGTGVQLPHSKEEHIAVKDMEKMVDILTALLKEYTQ